MLVLNFRIRGHFEFCGVFLKRWGPMLRYLLCSSQFQLGRWMLEPRQPVSFKEIYLRTRSSWALPSPERHTEYMFGQYSMNAICLSYFQPLGCGDISLGIAQHFDVHSNCILCWLEQHLSTLSSGTGPGISMEGPSKSTDHPGRPPWHPGGSTKHCMRK